MFVTENKNNLELLLISFYDWVNYSKENDPNLSIASIRDQFIENEMQTEKAWDECCKEQDKIIAANQLILEDIQTRKGEAFHTDIVSCIKECEANDHPIELVATPIGDYQEEHEFGPHIPGMWVEQRCMDDSCWGTICIQIEPDQYLKFHFSM